MEQDHEVKDLEQEEDWVAWLEIHKAVWELGPPVEWDKEVTKEVVEV